MSHHAPGPLHDHATVRAEYHHRKAEIQQHQNEAEMHHNVAPDEGERKRSWFVVRVIRRLLGRRTG